jgi:hypothetical protein
MDAFMVKITSIVRRFFQAFSLRLAATPQPPGWKAARA